MKIKNTLSEFWKIPESLLSLILPQQEYAPWIIDACESDADLNTGNPKNLSRSGKYQK